MKKRLLFDKEEKVSDNLIIYVHMEYKMINGKREHDNTMLNISYKNEDIVVTIDEAIALFKYAEFIQAWEKTIKSFVGKEDEDIFRVE